MPNPAWVSGIFTWSQQSQNGGVVRRQMHDVMRLDALGEIIEEARARGFHVIETGDQLVILCHEGSMVIHC